MKNHEGSMVTIKISALPLSFACKQFVFNVVQLTKANAKRMKDHPLSGQLVLFPVEQEAKRVWYRN